MKILLALAAFALTAVLVVSATMGAGTLVPGDDDEKKKPAGGIALTPSGKPRILPTRFSPPTIKGTGFKPGENVTVKVAEAGIRGKKRARADGSGSFTVRLAGAADRCAGMTATAIGDKGSRASFQLSSFTCAAPGVGS